MHLSLSHQRRQKELGGAMEEKGEGRRVTVQRKEGGMIEMGWSGVGEEGWIAGE